MAEEERERTERRHFTATDRDLTFKQNSHYDEFLFYEWDEGVRDCMEYGWLW